MIRPVHKAISTAGVAVSSFALLAAATPTFWQVSTQADFLKGDVENLSIDSDGRVMLAPSIDLVADTAAPFVWALLPTPDGGYLLGTGNEGRVLRVDAGGEVGDLFDAPELEVHALATAPDGTLYVGTSPEGKIYRVTPDGNSDVFFDPEDKYIWALAVDADGNVYAGTGEKGNIYRIAPSGDAKPFYATKATHVVALSFDRNGRLLAGTGSPGRLYRFDASGAPFVLLDSPLQEIHALRVDDKGVVYAAAVGRKPAPEEGATQPPGPEPGPPPVPTVSSEITSISILDRGITPGRPPGRQPEARRAPIGAVYRIMPDGVWDTLWDSPDDTPYDLAFEAGAVMIGTGGSGKLYLVSGDPPQVTLAARMKAQQITQIAKAPDGAVVFGTANPGRVLRVAPGRARRGSYESEIRDANTLASWGTISWRYSGGGLVELFSRSGNTATPDETWSAWAGPYTNATGEQITSPKARYLQWRAVLSAGTGPNAAASPILTSVTTAYLPRNLRPRVAAITVHEPGTVFQRPFPAGEIEIAGYQDHPDDDRRSDQRGVGAVQPNAVPTLGRWLYEKGLQTFVWKAEDDNADTLQYDVLYRREGQTAWKALVQGLWDPIFVWDTTSVPDGSYTIKVVASDSPSSSPSTALVGELESTGFQVDNTPPVFDVGIPRRDEARTIITFTVRDEQSPVQRVEYSLDATRWRVIYPTDGIPDSRTESFELALDGDVAARSVILRATDRMNNVATAVAGR